MTGLTSFKITCSFGLGGIIACAFVLSLFMFQVLTSEKMKLKTGSLMCLFSGLRIVYYLAMQLDVQSW
jgi:hypothetical protein